MSETVFTKVDYDLNSIINYIALGEIGLPDIQRPFIWKNVKVRDLFDSMYHGYPIGHLLFWQNGFAADAKKIGTDQKQKPARLVIVDGQQRLTSLYSVFKSVPVVRKNYSSEKIFIAFNPLKGNFEVADAAIRQDKLFIPDISILWGKNVKITKVISEYISDLNMTRTLSEEEETEIEYAIQKLQNLRDFPLTALELAPDISEESVSVVFVRINSKGTPLNQADFILTLMSVFWDEGRKELEQFCREARQPSALGISPYNFYLEPYPDQLLRVSVGVAFKRAQLRHVYTILRGKDMETGEFSEACRIQQFEILKKGQSKVVNLQYWHDFMNCIRMAGYTSGRMISSQNNLLYAYILYLIGRTEYGIKEFDLRKVIARWFFMSSVTGRYTGSPETAMEFDLARLREVKDENQFINVLNNVCEIILTNDFWNVSLPYDLATSSPRSPSLFAFYAALNLMDARVLFSKMKVTEKLNPAIKAPRSIERHHLFPKNYLKSKGITSTRETNQIANYALVEWGDNSDIVDQAPLKYLPVFKTRFTDVDLANMYHWHALPENWENLDYSVFLEKRRELIAQVIREGYRLISEDVVLTPPLDFQDLSQIIISGETDVVEFKSTLRTNLHTNKPDTRIEHSVLKTLAGFLNTNGGTLIIGLSDEGEPIGLEIDGFQTEDKMSLHLVNIIKRDLGPQVLTDIHFHFEDNDDNRVLVVKCGKAPAAVFIKDENDERFYIRTGPSTTELSASQTQEYLKRRFS